MKRFILAVLIACVFLGAILPVGVFAEGTEKATEPALGGYIANDRHELNSGPSYEILDQYADMTALRAYLDENLKACKKEFELYQFRIPGSAIYDLAFYIYKDISEAFHVSGIAWSPYSTYVGYLYIDYNMDKSTYDTTLAQCRSVAEKMTADLDGLSDVDQALVLHDRLALHCEYDLSISKDHIFDMVGAFLNGYSVCEGYAKAYSYLLDMVGIRNYYCASDLLRHGWNIVYIDGVKYHVDVTWDDPLYDVYGRVYHDNFLRSTQGIKETGHHEDGACDFDSSPSDTRYDDAYWQGSCAGFQAIDGVLYYIETSLQGDTYIMQVKNGVHSVLCDVSDSKPAELGYYYGDQKLASDGQDLLFTKSDGVYRYCLETNTVEPVWLPSIGSGQALFGFVYADGTLQVVPHNGNNFEENTNHTNLLTKVYTPHSHAHDHTYDDACDDTCNICGDERHAPHDYDDASDLFCNLCGAQRPAYVRGDLDGKAGVDMDDAIYLLFAINFPDIYKVDQLLDFDGDGDEDMDDAIYLLFHVNFSSEYPLH